MVPVASAGAIKSEYDRVAGCTAGGDKVICSRGIRDRRVGWVKVMACEAIVDNNSSRLPAERQSRWRCRLVGVNDECTATPVTVSVLPLIVPAPVLR